MIDNGKKNNESMYLYQNIKLVELNLRKITFKYVIIII